MAHSSIDILHDPTVGLIREIEINPKIAGVFRARRLPGNPCVCGAPDDFVLRKADPGMIAVQEKCCGLQMGIAGRRGLRRRDVPPGFAAVVRAQDVIARVVRLGDCPALFRIDHGDLGDFDCRACVQMGDGVLVIDRRRWRRRWGSFQGCRRHVGEKHASRFFALGTGRRGLWKGGRWCGSTRWRGCRWRTPG